MNESRKCQVLVIGAGPGGYVAGIRAAQLGLDTIVVEADKAGGTCLIRGCIPSKAIIHAAERFESLREHSSEDGHMGLYVGVEPEVDMSALVSWKDSIVDKLNKGVENLLKAAGADLVKGWAEFNGPKSCKVTTANEEISIEAENVILATHLIKTFVTFDMTITTYCKDSNSQVAFGNVISPHWVLNFNAAGNMISPHRVLIYNAFGKQ